MSETKRTPDRMQIAGHGEIIGGYRVTMTFGTNQTESATMYGWTKENALADAARLALAWNCHDDLLAVAKQFAALLHDHFGEHIDEPCEPDEVLCGQTCRAVGFLWRKLEETLAAIKKAEGQP